MKKIFMHRFMVLKKMMVLAIIPVAVCLVAVGCKSGGNSSTQDSTTLKDGLPLTGTSQSECNNSIVLDAVNTLCELFGAGSCVSQQSS